MSEGNEECDAVDADELTDEVDTDGPTDPDGPTDGDAADGPAGEPRADGGRGEREYAVADEGDLDPGERIVVELAGVEVGVFRTESGYRAYPNWCPHQGGPVCEGGLSGTRETTFDRDTLEVTDEWVKEGDVLNCPWHGWEFDVEDGSCLSGRKAKLPSYDVRVDDGDVVVSL